METPSITASAYTSSVLSGDSMFAKAAMFGQAEAPKDPLALFKQQIANQANQMQPIAAFKGVNMSARIIKVFIADPNENLPLDKRVLYTGDEKLTDLTDQELFFEVPIAEILATHNEVRKETVDKKQAEKFGRDIYLEPARIRDLRMVVVTVAQF